MKKILLLSCLVFSSYISGCSDSRPPAPAPVASPQIVAPPKRDHNYEVKDGMEYGYASAISADQKNKGQVATKILMFKYAGERDGKHQVHTTDGIHFSAIECSSPCEVMKIMDFIDKDYLRGTVRVDRIKNQPGSVANSVMEDAIAGKLRQYGIGRDKQRFQVWVDEKKGYREFIAKPS